VGAPRGVAREDIRAGLRLLTGLPGFLRRPLTLADARRLLAERLARREADFLRVARAAAAGPSGSPYGALLRRAGCEEGDLARLVARDGVEGALGALARAGVYVTVDEFKGRRPIVRGGLSLDVTPRAFLNPAALSHLSAHTGGSRGEGVPIPVDLAWVRDRAVHLPVVFDALGWDGARVGVWGVPGAAAMVRILEYAAAGARPERWFSPVRPDSPGLHPRYRWSARTMRWASLAAGAALPRPEHVLPEDPAPVLDWVRVVLAAGGRPYLHTISSAAVRLAEAARGRGQALDGVRLTMGSEPVTPARLRAVRDAGAEALPRYGSVESGPVAFGCAAGQSPDDVHVLGELHAVVQSGTALGPGVRADTFLVSSLRPSATLLLLNLSLGDGGVLDERRCGCPLDRPGWRTHLRGVRSAEKLTAAGMAFLDTDVVTILEDALPHRFGGGPADYQLVEDETDDGRPRLRLLVHPRVGPLDPAAVVDAFLRSLGQDGGARRVGELTWRGARLLELERRPPMTTAAGKILHLHAPR
jgi:hypothetical protein